MVRRCVLLSMGVVLVAGCALATARDPSVVSPVTADLREVHLQSGKSSNAMCIGCHAPVVSRTSSDAVTPTFHFIHVERQGQTCASCHKSVNLAAQRPASFTDPGVCSQCHEPFQKPFQKRAGR